MKVMKDLLATMVTMPGQINDELWNDLQWYVKHGGVWAIWKNGEIVAVVWLSTHAEDMAVIAYEVNVKKAGKDLLNGAYTFMKFLSRHYPCILGTIDEGNDKAWRFARRLGFVPIREITVAQGRRKTLVIYAEK